MTTPDDTNEAPEEAPEDAISDAASEEIDLSWLTESEAIKLEGINLDMEARRAEILRVDRWDGPGIEDGVVLFRLRIEVEATALVGRRKVRRAFRLLRPDEVWPFREPSHKSCNGRGYHIFTTDADGRLPVEIGQGEERRIEYRVSCTCASSRYRKAHPETVIDSGYGFVPLAAGGGALAPSDEIIAEEERQDAEEEISERGTECLSALIERVRSKIEDHEARAKTLAQDVEQELVPYRKKKQQFVDAIAARKRAMEEEDIRVDRARLAVTAAEELARRAEAEVKRIATKARRVVEKSEGLRAVLAEELAALERFHDRTEPSKRAKRLMRELRICEKDLAKLRERLARREREAKTE